MYCYISVQSFEDALSALKKKPSNLRIVPAGYDLSTQNSSSNHKIRSSCSAISGASDNRNVVPASDYRNISRAGLQSKKILRPNNRQNKSYSPTDMKSCLELEVKSSTSVASSYTDRSSSPLNNIQANNKIASNEADDSSSCDEDDGNINKALGVCPENKPIGCTCPSCILWDNNKVNEEEDVFSDNTENSIPKIKIATKPPLLLKKEDIQGDATIKCASFVSPGKESRMQKLRSPSLLVHG